LVMRLIRDESLATRLQRTGALPANLVIHLLGDNRQRGCGVSNSRLASWTRQIHPDVRQSTRRPGGEWQPTYGTLQRRARRLQTSSPRPRSG
jgi:hypothetical protein